MMKIKKNLKYVLNIFFIVVIGWLTVRLLFRGEEFSDIVADLHLAKKSWLAVGAVCVFCYVAGESVIIKYMLRLFVPHIFFYSTNAIKHRFTIICKIVNLITT